MSEFAEDFIPGDGNENGAEIFAKMQVWVALINKAPRVRPEITDVEGGAATDLDSIATVGSPIGLMYITAIAIANGPWKIWVVQSGTDAHDPANGVVRPLDFHATTNQKVFKAWGSL